jgi:predicted DNA-binding protein (MmcQ/YjbR family)
MSKTATRARAALRKWALAYPGAHEDFPWGESVIKVKKKVFVFLGREGDDLSVSVKLPISGAVALTLPFAEPTGYGLGKGGWVTASFGPREQPPLDMLHEWIDESYRAVAPKKLSAELSESAVPAAKTRPSPRPRAAKASRSRKAVNRQ